MKKILAILLAATMLLALAACGTAADTATEPPADETAPASEAPASEAPADEGDAAETYVVGICQQMTHVAQDSATVSAIYCHLHSAFQCYLSDSR